MSKIPGTMKAAREFVDPKQLAREAVDARHESTQIERARNEGKLRGLLYQVLKLDEPEGGYFYTQPHYNTPVARYPFGAFSLSSREELVFVTPCPRCGEYGRPVKVSRLAALGFAILEEAVHPTLPCERCWKIALLA